MAPFVFAVLGGCVAYWCRTEEANRDNSETTQKRLRNDSEMTPSYSRVISESFPSDSRVIPESFPSRVSGRDSNLVAEGTPPPRPPVRRCDDPWTDEIESDSSLHFVLADILRQGALASNYFLVGRNHCLWEQGFKFQVVLSRTTTTSNHTQRVLCEIDTEITRGPALTTWSASGQNVFLADVIAGVFEVSGMHCV